jgi:preprotein translocase subunit SecB
MSAPPTLSTDATERQPGITIAQIFLERVHFEHRGDALALPPNTPPDVGPVNVQVATGINEEKTAGITRITVGTDPARNAPYTFELSITGMFAIQPGAEGSLPLDAFLVANSVPLLYPFVREAVAAITQRGRFGPVWLNPINTKPIADRLQRQDWQKGTPSRPPSASQAGGDKNREAAAPAVGSRDRSTARSQARALRRQPKTPQKK